MSTQRSTELIIPLSPSQVGPVKRWLTTFSQREENWAESPYLEGSCLRISALCFPFFLGYVNRHDSNEFDVQRLRCLGVRAIRDRLCASVNPVALRYLRRALENLEIISVGEFLEEGGLLPSPF